MLWFLLSVCVSLFGWARLAGLVGDCDEGFGAGQDFSVASYNTSL